MPAFIIADIEVDDAGPLQDYIRDVPALIEKHGGKYRVRGGEQKVLEGSWVPARLVILEFPDRDSALAFYNDPEYEPHKACRIEATNTSLVLIDGID